MTRIMMMGDSWACGEWRADGSTHGVTHPGTRRFLEEAGHRVISVADGGSSNWAQLDRISPHHALQRDRASGGNMADADVVLWFVTDPIRDLKDSQPGTMEQLHLRQTQLLTASIRDMARLAGDREVWLVGGVGVIPPWVQVRQPRWRVIVPDLLRWLLPRSEVSVTHLNRAWRYDNCDAELLDHHEIQEQRASSFRWRAEHRLDSEEHRWFWPDGVHPNREAHRRLTQELILPLL